MKRHSISHGAATLVTMVSAGLLVQVARGHLPAVVRALDSVSLFILEATGLGFPVEFLSPVLLASILALIWGLAFGVAERFRRK